MTALLFFMSTNLMAQNYTKPYYGIELDLAQVGIDLRLNDIPIYYDNQKGQLTVDLPAPSSIIDGDNEIKLTIFTPYIDQDKSKKMEVFLPESYVTANLYVQDINDPENKKTILTSISIKINGESTPESVDDSTIFLKNTSTLAVACKTVSIDSPFPVWAWQKGSEIENNDDNFKSLVLSYKDLYSALSNKDTNKVFSLYENRAKETAIAYHLNSTSDGHKKINTGENMNDPELELIEFWEEGMSLNLFANNKLASITDKDGDSPIVYYVKDSELVKVQKFMFYKDKNNNWIMIR